jgi:hypothetical protein
VQEFYHFMQMLGAQIEGRHVTAEDHGEKT